MKRILIVLSATALFLSCSTPKQKTLTYYTPKAKIKMQTEIEMDTQIFLRAVNLTTEDIRKRISIDTGCPIEKVSVIALIEEKAYGQYDVTICGRQIKYKRDGSNLIEQKSTN